MSNKLRKVNWQTSRGASSRDEILDMAGHIMSREGYDGTSIAALCDATGLNVSSIYWHFGSKAGVLAALMERGAQRFLSHLEADLANAPRHPSAQARLRWVMARFCEIFASHREFLRLMIVLLIKHDDDDALAVVRRVRAQGRESVRRQIEIAFRSAQEERRSRGAARIAEQLADYAIALIEGAFLAKEASPALSFETLMEQLADAIALMGEAQRQRRRSSALAERKSGAAD